MTPHFYKIDIHWKEGRLGTMCSPEVGTLELNPRGCIAVATPPEFPKGIPGVWSPEHFFTAAVSSCLMTTFLAVAENSKLEFINFSCPSQGKLDKVDGKYLMTEVILQPEITIRHESDRAKALRVLQLAEAACLISNSVKSKITMDPKVLVG